MDESRRLSNGKLLEFEHIYPLDAAFDTLADAPEDIRSSKRYKDTGDFSIDGMVNHIRHDFGEGVLDIVVHSLANATEVKNPLLETSRTGYLAAIGVSAYSLVAMVSQLAPLMRTGWIVPFAHLHGERASHSRIRRRNVFGESRARERHSHSRLRSGPQIRRTRQHDLRRTRMHHARRARSESSREWSSTAPPTRRSPIRLTAEEVGATAAFLCSPLGSGITGTTIYVDKGYHAMGMAVICPMPDESTAPS